MRRALVMVSAMAVVSSLGLCAFGQNSHALSRARIAIEAGELSTARALLASVSDGGDPEDTAVAGYLLATVADAELDFSQALAGYRAFVARDPGSRYVTRAQARIEDLETHAEGGFAPLRALEAVRRSEVLSNDPVALRALARSAAVWPPGPTRTEARLLVATALAGRLGQRRDALPLLRAVLSDPAATQAQRDLAAAQLVVDGSLSDEPVEVAETLSGAVVDGEVRAEAQRLARRARLSLVAKAIVLGFAMLAVALALVAWRHKRVGELVRAVKRPVPLIQLAMLCGGGAFLAKSADGHEGAPFYVLGAGALGVYLVGTVWAVLGSQRKFASTVRAVVCVLGVLAVSFLAMESLDPMMLDGISL